jgi:hypothetical protein
MKFKATNLLKEESEFRLDGEGSMVPVYTGRGIYNPKNEMGTFAAKHTSGASFRPTKSEDQFELDRIVNMIYNYLGGSHWEPRQALYQLRSRINHLGFDFKFDRNETLLPGKLTFRLMKYGEKFGTTPTTDLTKDGFDRGADYMNIVLTMDLVQDEQKNFYFQNIQLKPEGAAQMEQPKLTKESFYYFIENDEDFNSNVFNPIMINLTEKAESGTLTENEVYSRFEFIIERISKRCDIVLSEESKNYLISEMISDIFE